MPLWCLRKHLTTTSSSRLVATTGGAVARKSLLSSCKLLARARVTRYGRSGQGCFGYLRINSRRTCGYSRSQNPAKSVVVCTGC